MKILFLHARRELTRKALFDPTNYQRKLSKGLVRNGHDVLGFSYLDCLAQLSPFSSRKLARFARAKALGLLSETVRQYRPDVVMVSHLKRLDRRILDLVKEQASGATYVALYGDQSRGCDPRVVAVARLCDWLVATSAGDVLTRYKDAGVPHCAFMPNPADPDIEGPRQVEPKWRSEMLFTGKISHKLAGQDGEREGLIRRLVDERGMTVWGCLGRSSISGRDYTDAICGTKIALSVNAFNDVRLYHSDRLTHYLSHGAFVLAKYVPGSELLLRDGEHLCYFNTPAQCLEGIDRALADNDRRRAIAHAGMRRVHDAFNCERMAANIMELVTNGEYKEDWAEIV